MTGPTGQSDHAPEQAGALFSLDLPPEVVTVGETYEQLGREAGLSLSETVGVFLYFRDFLYDSVVDVYQASGQRAAREWANMHRRIAAFTNAVLLALIAAYERSRGRG